MRTKLYAAAVIRLCAARLLPSVLQRNPSELKASRGVGPSCSNIEPHAGRGRTGLGQSEQLLPHQRVPREAQPAPCGRSVARLCVGGEGGLLRAHAGRRIVVSCGRRADSQPV